MPSDRLERAYRATRPHLLDIAYRMLGSRLDAEDVVQEAFARLLRVPEPQDTPGWLAVVVSRLCIDHLRSASRRASYQGLWLPEPVCAGTADTDPADRVTIDETVSMALLVVLEQLSPAERAALILHDVFAMPFGTLASLLSRSPAACRQLASRARRRIREQGGQRFPVDAAEHRHVAERFISACASGDVGALTAVLDPEVVLITDGGGTVPAGHRPVPGATRVARLLRRGFELYPCDMHTALVNGEPALIAIQNGHLIGTVTFAVRKGRLHRLFALGNPAKLAYLAQAYNLPVAAANKHDSPRVGG